MAFYDRFKNTWFYFRMSENLRERGFLYYTVVHTNVLISENTVLKCFLNT